MVRHSLLAGALSVTASLAAAQVPAGGEFRVNTVTTGPQADPQADTAENGDFVVVWTGSIPIQYEVFAQRYRADGTPVGTEFQVNSYTTGHQSHARIAVRRDGSFVVVWRESGGNQDGTWVQRFDPAGARVGAELRVGATGDGGVGRALDVDAVGSFVVVWSAMDAADPSAGIFARRVSAKGALLGAEFLVNTYTTAKQSDPEIAMGPGGDFVIVWTSQGQDGSAYGVFGQMFDAAGTRLGGEFRVNTTTTSSQMYARVARGTAGDFVVAWGGYNQDGDDWGVFAQRFASSGARLGGEFRVNTYTTSRQTPARVAMGDAGGFVVTWAAYLQDGSGSGVFGQRFTREGLPRGGEFRVNSYTTGPQTSTGLAHDAVGNFVVLWYSPHDGSGFGAFAQRYGGLHPRGLRVDLPGNGILEPGEVREIRPTWLNGTTVPTGMTTLLTGPGGPNGGVPAIFDPAGVYPTTAHGATAECSTCPVVGIPAPSPRPAVHWDATVLESVLPDAQGQQKTWVLHVGRSFDDVPATSPFYRFVETLLHHGVTGGCGPDTYCPASTATREQMAVFMLIAREGAGYVPPPCQGTPTFPDVPASSPYCRWIEELARRGVVGGCGGGNYCPTDVVLRGQMPIFILRTLEPGVIPPQCGTTPMFADLPASSPYCRYVEELARRGVVTGCGGGNYCPQSPVTREQMGVFISVSFGLTLYGP